ncbi:MAG: 3-phosphoshikimate 1-carboxyvinyltransferase [Phycisphaerales bacterium]|nr:3-phosphoshikimate 1-carboxyvinyltransferase [Phycisphaerales bacterium]
MEHAEHATRTIRAMDRAIHARVEVPGSKSLSNRHLVLAALADGTSALRGVLASDDCDRLRIALLAMGAKFARSHDAWTVEGVSGKPRAGGSIDLGHGGTPTRFMLAVAALCADATTVDGSERMRERPVDEGVDMLVSLGATAEYPRAARALPIVIHGPLTGRSIEVRQTASSQFISALMLIAPCMPHGLEIHFQVPPTSASYLELSIDALRAVGVSVDVERGASNALTRVSIAAQTIRAHAVIVEPDASSAVYFGALAALVGGSVEIPQLSPRGSQPDLFFFRDLQARGVEVVDRDGLSMHATRGAVLHAHDSNYECAPDAAVMAMVLAACADAPSLFTGLATLRVKESDRIETVAAGLRALGGQVDVGADWARIHPLPQQLSPAVVQTCNDHRIAMAFAILGCAREGVTIADPDVVAKSWPGFWNALEGATAVL